MSDVATLAGVSSQTVSRVARGEDSVRPATAERVRAAMKKLGYTPNTAARALRYGSFRTIGIVAHSIDRTGEAHIISSIIDAARAHDYGVMLFDAPSADAEDLTAGINRLTQSVDGLVLLRLETRTPERIELMSGLPIVVGDSRLAKSHTAVGCDQAGGTLQAVGHLLNLGHRTVHHVTGPEVSVQARAREEAWRKTLASASRVVPEPVRGDWTPESGYRAGLELLARREQEEVTAVFCGNDEMAQGLLCAFHEHGVGVPDEISVVGFDDVRAAHLWPPLTTVFQDFTTIGRELVRTLMEQIADPSATTTQQTLVPTRLVERRSTAAPRLSRTPVMS